MDSLINNVIDGSLPLLLMAVKCVISLIVIILGAIPIIKLTGLIDDERISTTLGILLGLIYLILYIWILMIGVYVLLNT